jgi:hypothetical protein
VSSDTSPPSRYRLDSPARTGGAAAGAPAPRSPIAAEPSWTKVIGTTLRLWVRRHVLHVPDAGKIGRARAAGVAAAAAVIVVAVVAAIAAATVALTSSPASHHARHHAPIKPALTAAQKQAQAAAARAAAANSAAAATWIAAQVSEQIVIGCDPATCAAILSAGYANGGEIVLQPGVGLPSAGALVVATPAVRAQYGAQLAATAPEVIAVFGTGPQSVQVRVVVPGGQAAYSAAASSAITASRNAGLKLISDSRVRVHPAARPDLTAGLVDSRLLTVLQELGARYQVDIYSFADGGPVAGSSVAGSSVATSSAPFRLAEIVGLTRREVVGAEKLLKPLPDQSRPALAVLRLPGGKYGLTIWFKAPSPY